MNPWQSLTAEKKIGKFTANGIARMPKDISELYVDSAALQLRWQGIYTLSNYAALRQLRRFANRDTAERVGSAN